jgi:squalene cyclase
VRAAALAAALLLGLPALTACGGGSDAEESSSERAREQAAEQELETAADRSTCRADAEAVDAPYADGFPQAWVFPPDTTVYDVEDREGTGVIVTGISSAQFADILDFLNHDAVDAGFAVTEGETEEHDAEANWKAGDEVGRWAIRESADCPGETVVQVFAAGE